jgi:hypothetical protein
LSADPRAVSFTVEHAGSTQTIHFGALALAKIKTRLDELGISPTSFPWRPAKLDTASPYPGLGGFRETEADVFFGRGGDIARALGDIRRMRRSGTAHVLVIQAASGAGKSSFLHSGLWARLNRDPDFIPMTHLASRNRNPHWGKRDRARALGLVWRPWEDQDGAGDLPVTEQPHAQAELGFIDLLNEAIVLAQNDRKLTNSGATPPSPVLSIDQADERFAVEGHEQSRSFLNLLVSLLRSPQPDEQSRARLLAQPIVLLTIRRQCTSLGPRVSKTWARSSNHDGCTRVSATLPDFLTWLALRALAWLALRGHH